MHTYIYVCVRVYIYIYICVCVGGGSIRFTEFKSYLISKPFIFKVINYIGYKNLSS